MLAAVTGGAGWIGHTLIRSLLDDGARVRTLAEPGDLARALEGLDVEILRGSVLDRVAVHELVGGADVVYHLAARIDLGPDRDGSVHRTNVGGTARIVEACRETGARLVHTSSHHALRRRPLDEPLDERRPLALDDRCVYHRSKAAAEVCVLDAVGRGLDAVIASPGTVMGPGDYRPSMMGRALLDLYHGRAPLLLDVVSDFVDVRDVASGLISAAKRGRRGERYLLTGEVLAMDQMTHILREVTGRRMPRIQLPLWVGWLLVPLEATAARLGRRPARLTPGMLRAAVSNDRVSHEKAGRELGFSPRTVRESLVDTFSFFREQGWLR